MHPSEHQKRNLRTAEAAAYLGLSRSTLEKHRLAGTGPRYAKLGKICIYDVVDLEAFKEAHKRQSTSEPPRSV